MLVSTFAGQEEPKDLHHIARYLFLPGLGKNFLSIFVSVHAAVGVKMTSIRPQPAVRLDPHAPIFPFIFEMGLDALYDRQGIAFF